MEIEKHIQNLKDYIRIDKENINYDDSDFAQFCKSHCEDIQAILDELDNRISKDDLKNILRKVQDYQLNYKDTVLFNIIMQEIFGETEWTNLEDKE